MSLAPTTSRCSRPTSSTPSQWWSGAGLVAQQHDRLVEVADDQVGPAVVVQVADGQRRGRWCSVRKYGPPCGGDVVEAHVLPLPCRALGCAAAPAAAARSAPDGWRMTWPLTMTMSSQPSLSRSRKPVPKPTYCRPRAARPAAWLLNWKARPSPAAQVAVQGVQLVLVVGDQQRRPAAAVVIAGVHAHAAVGQPVGRRGPRRLRRAIVLEAQLPPAAAVEVEEVVGRVVGDVDVRLAVAVDVHGDHAQPLAEVPLLVGLAQPLRRPRLR